MDQVKIKAPKYNFKSIEKKWQKYWKENKTNQVDLEKAENPFYNLMMFPYPSAEGLHVGSVYTFSGVDTFGRFKRMQGYDVFEPIGLDGFGIHSENYAMKIGEHIKDVSKRTEKNFYRQLASTGNMFDWSRTLETYDPKYYKWTQWLFLKMFEKGLAYQKRAKVNWCPSCKTVLSDEQVIQGLCERCDSQVEKKELKQWFFKITDYADRLLENSRKEDFDWPDDVKLNQQNWIGRSEGATVKFPISNSQFSNNPQNKSDFIEVFTTRPDTLFGATYMVIAPEHKLIEESKDKIENWDEVEDYVNKAKNKSEQERKEEEKEKTGIELKGIKAINPATKEEIPVWVADYVLAGYGTGAIMAVPAHDERDFEFANKFGLEIKEVVTPVYGEEREDSVYRETITAIIQRESDKKFLFLELKGDFDNGLITPVIGGIKEGESLEDAAKREVEEETGLKVKSIRELGGKVESHFYAGHKKVWRKRVDQPIFVELESEEQGEISEEEKAKHDIVWLDEKEVLKKLTLEDVQSGFLRYIGKDKAYCLEGRAVNSDFIDGLKTPEAKQKMIEWLEGKNCGTKAVDYRLRDWCVSRQRYWGPPIPIIHCEKCGAVPVPEADLPVELPDVDDLSLAGEGRGPLAKNEEFVKVKCPKCGGEAERETDVSDSFVDSSWYFFRYPSTEIDDRPFDKERTKKWLPVDSYIGGKEHTVLHLLYSRFVTMVLHDLGYIDFDEPYKRFFGHGLITKDGAKMSKSKGNVVNPDEMIEKYGADTVRLYLRFLGDFSQGGDWRDSGAEGIFKFVNRLWDLFFELENATGEGVQKTNMIDKTIKVVGEDLEKLSFNTAVARIMELVNWAKENISELNQDQARRIQETLALVVAPMMPHIAEEFWNRLGNDDSVFNAKWPEFDENNVLDDEIELVLQVNGKVRDRVQCSREISKEDAEKLALESDKIKVYTEGKEVLKVIHVLGKLVNIVVK